jgi:tRNA-Thr(GGU) m(6)t(6)A37 methyltransferase TsaA
VPSSLGTISLDPTFVGPDITDGLEHFSHVWVLFVFHLNSNTISHEAAMSASKPGSIFPSKIAPPALGGKKVGIFSTRSPHRPNPVGFTLVKLEKITRPSKQNKKTTLHISGLDLVDGTPILDIKPYVSQYDSVGWSPEFNTDSAGSVRQPDWIREGLTLRRKVLFNDGLLDALTEKDYRKQVYYKTESALRDVIEEVLSADVRSVWHTTKARTGGSKAPVVKSDGTRSDDKTTNTNTSTQQIDRFLVEFVIQKEVEDVNKIEGKKEVLDMVSGSGANDVVMVVGISVVK